MPHHVVVDGSNIATEGRSLPSLAQLNEAVIAFMAEHPDALITVVVDATFGHRIDAKEVKEFDEAVANNELVAPPAGAIGRGDAFVLSIAHKVDAVILTNDSYQEFHGQYDWLFEEGRLIGGKPVPHIGWVFVPRIPVRGAISRSAMKDAKRRRSPAGSSAKSTTMRVGSPEASLPMPVPKAPPPGARIAGSDKAASAAVMAEAIADAVRAGDPAVAAVASSGAPESSRSGRRRGGRGKGSGATAAPAVVADARSAAPNAVPTATQTVNDLLPFLSFVEHHPAGSSVNAIVENYSSHGAYVRVGDVKGYVPLRLMSDPAPRSAREFMKIGDAITLVVDSFAPARRSIDLAVAGMSTAKPPAEPVRRGRKTRSAAATEVEPTVVAAVPAEGPADVTVTTESERPAKGRGRKKAAAPVAAGMAAIDEAAAGVAAVEAAPAKPGRRRGASVASPHGAETVTEPAGAAASVEAETTKRPGRAKRVAAAVPAVEPAGPVVDPTPFRTAKAPARTARATMSATPAVVTQPAATPTPAPRATASRAKASTAKAATAKAATAKAAAADATAAKAATAKAATAKAATRKAATAKATKAPTSKSAAPVAPAKAPTRAKRSAAATPVAATAKRTARAAPVAAAPAPLAPADEAPATPVRRRRVH